MRVYFGNRFSSGYCHFLILQYKFYYCVVFNVSREKGKRPEAFLLLCLTSVRYFRSPYLFGKPFSRSLSFFLSRRPVRSVPSLPSVPKINSPTNINVKELAVCPVMWPDESTQKNRITWKYSKKLRGKISNCGIKDVDKTAPVEFEICSWRKFVEEHPKLHLNAADIGVPTTILPALQPESVCEIRSLAFQNKYKSKKRTADNKRTTSKKIRGEENLGQTSSSVNYCTKFIIERKDADDDEIQNLQGASSISRNSPMEFIDKNFSAEYKEYSFGLSFENGGNDVASVCEKNKRSVSKLPVLTRKNWKSSCERSAVRTGREEHIDVTLQKNHEAEVNGEESYGDVIDTSKLKREMYKNANRNNNACKGYVAKETCKNCPLVDGDVASKIYIEEETTDEHDFKKIRTISTKLVPSADDVHNEDITSEGGHNEGILKCQNQDCKFCGDDFICERNQSPCESKLQNNIHVAQRLVRSMFENEKMKNAPENLSAVEDAKMKLHTSGRNKSAGRGNNPNIISSSKSCVDDELTLRHDTINEKRLCKKISNLFEMEELKGDKLGDEKSRVPSTNATDFTQECDEFDRFYNVELKNLRRMNPTFQGKISDPNF